MSNELLFIVSALVDILFVFGAARLGPKWLLGSIALNLVLIGIFGSKLIVLAGFVTNAGNAFYACVFLATHLLLERQKHENRLKTIWFGLGAMLLFAVLSQLAVALGGAPSESGVSEALSVVFAFSPRVVVASMLAFIFAQHLNIWIYQRLKASFGGRHLWLRSNVAGAAGQLVDSSIFFTIAFLDLPGPMLLQAILAGWIVKMVVMAMGTPFLYADRHLRSR